MKLLDFLCFIEMSQGFNFTKFSFSKPLTVSFLIIPGTENLHLLYQYSGIQGSHDREKSGKSREFCKGISRPGKSREKCVVM